MLSLRRDLLIKRLNERISVADFPDLITVKKDEVGMFDLIFVTTSGEAGAFLSEEEDKLCLRFDGHVLRLPKQELLGKPS